MTVQSCAVPLAADPPAAASPPPPRTCPVKRDPPRPRRPTPAARQRHVAGSGGGASRHARPRGHPARADAAGRRQVRRRELRRLRGCGRRARPARLHPLLACTPCSPAPVRQGVAWCGYLWSGVLLPSNPPPCAQACSAAVECCRCRDLLRKTRHNGFPVVRDTPQGGVCVGLLVRDHLLKLLVEAVKRGTCQHLEIPFR